MGAMTKEPMKPNLLKAATEAQSAIDREYDLIAKAQEALDTRAGELERKAAQLTDKEFKLGARERELDQRNEEIVRKEGLIRSDEAARLDLQSAVLERKEADKALKLAENTRIEMKLKEEELAKRELALSEEKKSYQVKIEQEFAARLLGRMR